MRSVLGRTHKCVVCRVASTKGPPPLFPEAKSRQVKPFRLPVRPARSTGPSPKQALQASAWGTGQASAIVLSFLVLGLTPFQPQLDVTRQPAASDSQLTCSFDDENGQVGEVLSPSRVARARTFGGNTSPIGATRRRKLSPSPLPRGHPGLTSCSEPLGIL